jgi:hypothetical protein
MTIHPDASVDECMEEISALEAEIMRLRTLYDRCIAALIWCSGSADFSPGGLAHVGWQKLVKPLLDELLPQERAGTKRDDDRQCLDDGSVGLCAGDQEDKMSRIDPSNEPARQPDYRRSYAKMHEQIRAQDGCITWLLVELRALQKRVIKLELANAHTVATRSKAGRSACS